VTRAKKEEGRSPVYNLHWLGKVRDYGFLLCRWTACLPNERRRTTIVTEGTVTGYEGDDPDCKPHMYSLASRHTIRR